MVLRPKGQYLGGVPTVAWVQAQKDKQQFAFQGEGAGGRGRRGLAAPHPPQLASTRPAKRAIAPARPPPAAGEVEGSYAVDSRKVATVGCNAQTIGRDVLYTPRTEFRVKTGRRNKARSEPPRAGRLGVWLARRLCRPRCRRSWVVTCALGSSPPAGGGGADGQQAGRGLLAPIQGWAGGGAPPPPLCPWSATQRRHAPPTRLAIHAPPIPPSPCSTALLPTASNWMTACAWRPTPSCAARVRARAAPPAPHPTLPRPALQPPPPGALVCLAVIRAPGPPSFPHAQWAACTSRWASRTTTAPRRRQTSRSRPPSTRRCGWVWGGGEMCSLVPGVGRGGRWVERRAGWPGVHSLPAPGYRAVPARAVQPAPRAGAPRAPRPCSPRPRRSWRAAPPSGSAARRCSEAT